MLKIGTLVVENRLIMAPMAGITDLSFRLMVKGLGAGLVTTEMVSAMGLKLHQKKTIGYLKSLPHERPLAVQIFGARPDVMAIAAAIAVESGADIVDINMGCPVKKVTKTGAGASLLRDPHRIEQILCAVRIACSVPLTVKTRAGWSQEGPNVCDIGRIVEDCGVDAIALHARFATQGYRGRADWRLIEKLKRQVKIPVIGNGDIRQPSDAICMRKQTGCDGVMIGRAAVQNPWIFRQIVQLEKGVPVREPDLYERRALIRDHYDLLSASVGEYGAVLRMRGLLLRYTKGLPESRRLREKIAGIKDRASLISIVDDYFHQLERSTQQSLKE